VQICHGLLDDRDRDLDRRDARQVADDLAPALTLVDAGGAGERFLVIAKEGRATRQAEESDQREQTQRRCCTGPCSRYTGAGGFRGLCLVEAVEFDDLLLHIAGEVRLDVLVETLVVLLLALPDLRDNKAAAIGLIDERLTDFAS
jgi:hypothetical protein